MPSDHCKFNPQWRCDRKVSSVVCVHEAKCVKKCINGECSNGKCICYINYGGDTCEILQCGYHNCSSHGVCLPSGCDCHIGWSGIDCTIPCDNKHFGKRCSQKCMCKNNAVCSSITGYCDCQPGFKGTLCDQECDLGFYGKNCEFECNCQNNFQCTCNRINGLCSNNSIANISKSLSWASAQCLLSSQPLNSTWPEGEMLFLNLRWISFATLSYIILCGSVTFNIILLWKLYNFPQTTETVLSDDNITSSGLTSNDSNVNVNKKIVDKNLNQGYSWLNKFKKKGNRNNGYIALVNTHVPMIEETALLS